MKGPFCVFSLSMKNDEMKNICLYGLKDEHFCHFSCYENKTKINSFCWVFQVSWTSLKQNFPFHWTPHCLIIRFCQNCFIIILPQMHPRLINSTQSIISYKSNRRLRHIIWYFAISGLKRKGYCISPTILLYWKPESST